MLRIALAQLNVTVGDLKGNADKILDCAKQAKKQCADIVVFPELCLCGYPPEDLFLKESFIKDTFRQLKRIAARVSGITAVVGFADRDKAQGLFNAAAVLADGKIKGVYRKEILPNYGVFDEKRYFIHGEKNPLFKCGGILFGVSICEDIWIEDEVEKRQAKQGAGLLINLSSSPFDVGKLKQREKMLSNCAKKNRAYACYCNLVGGQDELVFDGGSLVVDKEGKIIARGAQFEEDLLVVDIDVKVKKKSIQKGVKVITTAKTLTSKQPAEQKRRKNFSQRERIFKALVLGTRDYVQKNRFKKVVVGLSGGIDSSLVAAIAVEAIGKENVIGVSMPSQYSSMGTQADARLLARNLGIKYMEVPIKDIFAVYNKALEESFKYTEEDVTEENIQARIRGNILMALSNKFGWLVLTTGNKSEVAVGYCTLYGDMSGGFAVIKDVPKTLVYDIARFINKESNGVIPQTIIDRAPSAELRENQTDQDFLPEYEVLDKLIKAYVEEHQPVSRIEKKAKNKELTKRIISLIDQSEYKRRQSPPGIKITPRAFGKDWRLPITNKYKGF